MLDSEPVELAILPQHHLVNLGQEGDAPLLQPDHTHNESIFLVVSKQRSWPSYLARHQVSPPLLMPYSLKIHSPSLILDFTMP